MFELSDATSRGRQDDGLKLVGRGRVPRPDRGRGEDSEQKKRLTDRPLHGHRRATRHAVGIVVNGEHVVRECGIARGQGLASKSGQDGIPSRDIRL